MNIGLAVVVIAAAVGFGGFALFASSSPSSASRARTTVTAHSTTSTTAPNLNLVTMGFVGDMDMGNIPQLPPSPSTYLNPVKAALSAPILFGNLEGTLTYGGYSKCGPHSTECYAFRNPPAYAKIYRTEGFTVLNSANNHSHDFGTQGVIDTSAALRGAGIVQAGLPGQIGVTKQGTVKVAFVDFAPYSTTNELLNFANAVALIHEAKHLANIVVVYMHAGAEGSGAIHVTGSSEYYYGENRGNSELFAHAAIDAGAALVIASGPHVLRGMEFYHGHLIAYSLGDFLSYYNFGGGGVLALTGILHVTLRGNGTFVSARFTSCSIRGAGQPVLDPSNSAAHLVAALSRDDFGNRAPGIAANGTVVPPPGALPAG